MDIHKRILNFTVGPVMMNEKVLAAAAGQLPYFRTPEFSRIMRENEEYICRFAKASKDSRAVFITGSGTASMEASVMNCFDEQDNVLVVNGGSFGKRFVELCRLHNVPYTEICLKFGESLTEEILDKYDGRKYTGFLVNLHETSTGVYYNPELISRYCKHNGLFLVVDAISSFLADPFEMEAWGVNIMLTGSQKALALAPGVSVIVLDEVAQERVKDRHCCCMYLDLLQALKDGERGQTPFTPAVGVLLQMNARLNQIRHIGLEQEQNAIKAIAEDFRGKVKGLPLEIFSKSMSNAVTALRTREGKDAYRVFTVLKDEYNIWVCPNGGEVAHEVFRVGHIGDLSVEDNDRLIAAMYELMERGIL